MEHIITAGEELRKRYLFSRPMSGQVPFALFSRKIPDPQFRGDFVDNDNYSGLRELTAQLLRLGHRKIGFINGQSYVSSAAERFSGFQSAMRDAGIDVGTDYPYLYSGNFNRLNSGKEGARLAELIRALGAPKIPPAGGPGGGWEDLF